MLWAHVHALFSLACIRARLTLVPARQCRATDLKSFRNLAVREKCAIFARVDCFNRSLNRIHGGGVIACCCCSDVQGGSSAALAHRLAGPGTPGSTVNLASVANIHDTQGTSTLSSTKNNARRVEILESHS
jgi:hypothetical protein